MMKTTFGQTTQTSPDEINEDASIEAAIKSHETSKSTGGSILEGI